MKTLAAFFIVVYAVGSVAAAYFRYEYDKEKAPARAEACKIAGGDGRFELRGRDKEELWCAREDGNLFPVLDPPAPSKEAPK